MKEDPDSALFLRECRYIHVLKSNAAVVQFGTEFVAIVLNPGARQQLDAANTIVSVRSQVVGRVL